MTLPRLLLLALLLATPLAAETVAAPPATVPAALLDREALLASLQADLTEHYAPTGTLEVDLIRPWISPAGAADATAVVATVLDYPTALSPSLLVRVRYLSGETILREDALALRVNLWHDAVATLAPLKRGDSLSLDGLEIRRVDILRDRQALPVEMINDDFVLAREIAPGHLLTWRDVVRRSLVHRGRMVEIKASDGALVITMKALALQDGARGEVVRVRNIDSKREFTAQVTAENCAEVRF